MIEFFEANPVDFTEEKDFLTEFGIEKEGGLAQFVENNKASAEAFATPYLFKYKTLALD